MSARATVDHSERLPATKLFPWAGAGFSAAANFIILSYVAIYATDTLQLSPAIVGVLILVSNICNAVCGLLAAWIVDRSPETRWGKARPYEFAVIGLWLATWLLFSTPAGLSEPGRLIWVFVTFITLNALFDTFLRANDSLYLARAFSGRRLFAKLTTRSGLITTIGSMIVSITLPLMLDIAGKSPEGWSLTVLIFSVPLAIIGMMRFVFIKEVNTTSDTGAAPVKISEIGTALRADKWIFLLAGVQVAASAVTGANVAAYYFRYVVGNLSLLGIMAALGVIVLPAILVLPRLMKRWAISQIIMGGALLGLLGSITYAFAGSNLSILTVGAILTALAILPISYLMTVMVLDLASYNEWKGQRRLESTLSTIVGVAGKLGMGFAGLITGQVLAASGYDGSKAAQETSAVAAIVGLYSWFPAFLFAVIFVLIMIYGRFDRTILPQVHDDLEALTRDSEVPTGPTASSSRPTA